MSRFEGIILCEKCKGKEFYVGKTNEHQIRGNDYTDYHIFCSNCNEPVIILDDKTDEHCVIVDLLSTITLLEGELKKCKHNWFRLPNIDKFEIIASEQR